MNIAGLNTKITFQTNTQTVDKYGNHKSGWTDYFTCHATEVAKTTPGSNGQEIQGSVTTDVLEIVSFTTRYCSELAGIEEDTARIVANGRTYNILNISRMGNKHNSLKFYCQKERR